MQTSVVRLTRVAGAVALVAAAGACGGTATTPLPEAGVAPAAAAAATASARAQVADLTGEWTFAVQSPNGPGTRSVILFQEGNQVTGTIASSRAAGELEGFVDDDVLYFVAVVDMNGSDFEITYEARIENGRLVDGVIDFGSYGSGTFTGERKAGL